MKEKKITSVTAAYFSPAGGTLNALETLCGCLGVQDEINYVNVTMPPSLVKPCIMEEQELFIAAVPVYAGRIPAVKGLFEGFRGKNTPCVILAAYGNRHYDDALAQLKHLLREQGFLVIGAAAVITPHTFAPALGAGRPDEQDRRILLEFAEKLKEKLEEKLETGIISEAEVPGNEMPEPKPAKPVEKTRDEKLCVNCRLCAKLCPVQAIDGETLAVDQEVCINCLNCVHVCRTHALSYHCEALNEFLTGHFSEPRKVETFISN